MPSDKRYGKMTIGIRTTRTTGCVHQDHHDGVEIPRRAQVEGEEAPTQVELTLGQLRKLSKEHAECLPSLACLSEVMHNLPSDEDEETALDEVNDMRKQRGLTRLG